MEEFINVGKRIPKLDAEEKVTGKAIYIHDLKVPGMLHGKILYSPHPHAKILSMDTSKAEKLPGVKAVLTGYNIPPINQLTWFIGFPQFVELTREIQAQ